MARIASTSRSSPSASCVPNPSSTIIVCRRDQALPLTGLEAQVLQAAPGTAKLLATGCRRRVDAPCLGVGLRELTAQPLDVAESLAQRLGACLVLGQPLAPARQLCLERTQQP